ncbi:MAG: SpoIIE family protein phosphatase [Candidatus Zixiibacteriota bacterium]
MEEKADFFDILLGAIRRETEAFNYYLSASEKSPSAESRSLLLQLAEEERRHRTILLQEYRNLKKLTSGRDKEVFLEKERISYHLPVEPAFKRTQALKSIDLAVVSLPTEFVGGDFFDTFIVKGEDKMGLFIFDVMGHGLTATELKAQVRVEWDKLRELYLGKGTPSLLLSPSSVITHLNQHLFQECQRRLSFLSLFYAVLDSSRNRLTYASAGHEPPLLFQKAGYSQLIEGDLLLCIDKDQTYQEATREIHSGDVLVMLTDGVVESMNAKDEEFSVKNLIRVVEENKTNNASQIVRQVMTALKDFMGGKPLTDEFTLAVAKLS